MSSGMKRLANAVANEPSFAKQAGLPAGVAKQLVSVDDPKTPSGIKMPGAPKPSGPSPMQTKITRAVQPGLPKSTSY